MCVCVCVCIHTYIHTYIHIYVCVCVCVYVYVCVYVCERWGFRVKATDQPSKDSSSESLDCPPCNCGERFFF